MIAPTQVVLPRFAGDVEARTQQLKLDLGIFVPEILKRTRLKPQIARQTTYLSSVKTKFRFDQH